MQRFGYFLGAIAATAILTSSYAQTAQAQVPDARFGAASPARVEEQTESRNKEPQPNAIPSLEIRQARPAAAPAGAENVTFTLKSIQISGSTVYSEAELANAYADKIGQKISLADIYGIAADLTRKYRNDGYVLSQVTVPPQTIESGEIRLQAVEGRLGEVTVREGEGSNYANPMGMARGYASRIDRNGPLRYSELERAVLLINDLPGVKARSILSPSANETGVADLLIIVDRKPYDAQLSINNFGTRYLGPLQIGAAGSVNSQLFKNDEKITGQVVLAPDTSDLEMSYFAASYIQPLSPSGLMLELYGNRSDTNPGHTLKTFDVEGENTFLGATVRYPFIRSRVQTLKGHATFDYRNVSSTSNVDIERNDRLRVARLGGRYELLDTFINTAFNTIDLEVSRGLDVLGTSTAGVASLSRPSGDPTFTKVTYEVQRLQNIYGRLNLLAAVQGQFSHDALLSAEQFGVGGINYGRGYDSSEIVGDRGIAGKIELQLNEPQKLSFLDNYQLYAFWDGGRVRNLAPTATTSSVSSLSSAGAGIRATLDPATAAGLMVAAPLTRDVQSKGDRALAVYFNLSRNF